MRLGALEVDLLRGSDFRLDGGAMFGIVPKPLWERKFPPDDRNRIGLTTNCLLVRGRDYVAVVEAGIGDDWSAKERDLFGIEGLGALTASLARHGVAPEDVDALVLSHLHFDHAGGASWREDGRPAPVFPRAVLYVQARELAHARAPNDRDRGSYRPQDWEPWAQAGRVEEVTGGAAVRPGLSVVPLPGHNRGMQAVRIESEGKVLFYFADAIPTAAHLRPSWTMAYDLYPAELVDTKKLLLAQAVSERWLCVFGHDPQTPWGFLAPDGAGYRIASVPRPEPVS
jgi:glyoxylase-like metal-dependent hydrolase (beta-lactamase superfamily II)